MRVAAMVMLLMACSGEETDTGPDLPDSPEPFEVVLGDPNSCAAYDKVRPQTEAEVGGWAVARLDPPYLPAQVEQIVVRFDGRTPCTVTLPGTLRVAVGGDTPPENPEFVYFGTIDASSEAPAIVFTMDMPATYVDVGQRLYVYHQSSGGIDAMRCFAYCQDEDKPSEGWWSSQSAPPHTYTTLGDRGLFGSVAVKMSGQAPVTIP